MIQSLSLQYALKYAAKGWKLFPARWDPLKKRHIGLVKWSKAATSDAAQIKTWAERHPKAYFCVALEVSDLTVLDVDDKNGKNGSDALKVLELINGGLPKTLTVQTPSGGRHYFFKGWRRQTVGVLAEGLDTPGMVPIPGSEVPAKGSYKVMEKISPAAIPGWISDQLGRAAEKSQDCDIPAVELDQDHNLQWARQYAREAPPAIEGDGGDLRTFVTAASIRDRGLSEEACLDIMAEEYNPRCLPPWEFDELARKVANAYSYSRNRPGHLAAEAHFEASSAFEEKTTDDEAFMPDLRRLNYPDIPMRHWILKHRYAPGHITGTLAPPGVGKSTYTILESLSVASGKQLTGFEVAAPGSVWIYSTEETENELKRRFAAACLAHGLDNRKLPFACRITSGRSHPLQLAGLNERKEPRINLPLVKQIIERIQKHKIRLWIVDPFIRSHRVNENDNSAIDLVMQAFTMIADATQCAVSVVHHSRKKSGGSGDTDADMARGASAFIGAVRIAHTLRHLTDKEADRLGVAEEKRRDFLKIVSSKANAAPPTDDHCFHRKALLLPNGDTDGTVAMTLVKTDEARWSERLKDIADAVTVIMPAKKEMTVYSLSKRLHKEYLYLFEAGSLASIRRFLIEHFAEPMEYAGGDAPVRIRYEKGDGGAKGGARDRIVMEEIHPASAQ